MGGRKLEGRERKKGGARVKVRKKGIGKIENK